MRRFLCKKRNVLLLCLLVISLGVLLTIPALQCNKENVAKDVTGTQNGLSDSEQLGLDECESEDDLNVGIGLDGEVESEDETESKVETESEDETEMIDETESEIEIEQSSKQKTIGNLLLTALGPVGNTMYVWGGGWNEADTGAGIEAVTIGVSPAWAEFAKKQDASYDYQTTRYQIHNGLDCSGYVGWCIYNIMETENGKDGYVMKATDMAYNFSQRGWGSYVKAGAVTKWNAGDIMSSNGHVWIVVGACEDGSVVLLHSSPPGVRIAGTLLTDGTKSEAISLAEKYMSTYYPNWYKKYPECKAEAYYLTSSASMSWNRETLLDEEGLTEMSAEEVLEWMFSNR